MKGALGDTVNIRRTEIVGPAVSSELKATGIKAVVFAICGILAYALVPLRVAVRGRGVLALVHDVFITTGMFLCSGTSSISPTVAALLTLAGYSINNTVVVFDLHRENLQRYKKMPFEELLDLSINETLSHTVLTSSVTAVAVLALYVSERRRFHGFRSRCVRHPHRHLFVDLRRSAAAAVVRVKRDLSSADKRAASREQPRARPELRARNRRLS